MNWDAIAAVAEAVGAAGVIATLGYLAIQIRRSNLLATTESIRYAQTASNPTILAIAQDPDLARVFREGLRDRDSLSADERVRFDMVMGAMISGISASILLKKSRRRRYSLIRERRYSSIVTERSTGQPPVGIISEPGRRSSFWKARWRASAP